jgi:hypothetical protein
MGQVKNSLNSIAAQRFSRLVSYYALLGYDQARKSGFQPYGTQVGNLDAGMRQVMIAAKL